MLEFITDPSRNVQETNICLTAYRRYFLYSARMVSFIVQNVSIQGENNSDDFHKCLGYIMISSCSIFNSCVYSKTKLK